MKRLASALLAAALLAAPALAQDQRSVVTVVTSPEPQTQLMAMVLTMQAARQGASAHVLLCGPGGDMALIDAPDSATAGQPPRDMSPQGLMLALQQTMGATVEVCAIYLPGAGLDASALVEGVGVAKPPAMAAKLMDPNATVLSF